jgi:hypothetical protein
MKRLALLLPLMLIVAACQDERPPTAPELKVQVPSCEPDGHRITELICTLYPGGKLQRAALRKWASIQDKMPDAQDEAQRKAFELIDKTTRYWTEGKLLELQGEQTTAQAVGELTHLLFVYIDYEPSAIPELGDEFFEAEDYGIGVIDPNGDVIVSVNEWVAVDAPPGATEGLVVVTMQLLDEPTCALDNGSLNQTVGCWDINFYGQQEFGEDITFEACVAEPEEGMSDDEWAQVLLHKYSVAEGVVVLPWADPQHIDCSDFMGYEAPAPVGEGLAAGQLTAAIARPPKGLGGLGSSGSDFFGAVPEGAVPNIVSWWPGDGHYYDMYGGNHGTPIGDVSLVPGLFGDAFEFDGDGDEVLIRPLSPEVRGLQDLTIATWVMLDPESPPDDILRFVTLGGEKAVLRQEGIPGVTHRQLHFYMNFGSLPPAPGDLRHIWVDGAFQTGCYHYFAGTYDGQTMRAYLDGVEVGSTPVPGGTVVYGRRFAKLGASGSPGVPGEVMEGVLDEVMIFDRALEAWEIEEIYDAGGEDKCESSGVAIDGEISPGEWSGADVYGPVTVDLPDGGTTTATVYATNDATDLLFAVKFDQDLSSYETVTVAVRLDENPVDGAWNAGGDGNGDDGFTVQHKAFGVQVDRVYDSHYNTSVGQGQRDDLYGGVNNSVTAMISNGSSTVIEVAHPLNSGDFRDAVLVLDDNYGLLMFTTIRHTIGEVLITEITDLVPAWDLRTVQ